MNENLIVEDNTIYEIDPECLKKKRKCQGETGEKVETENTKKQKMQRRNRKNSNTSKNMNKMPVKFVFYRLYDKF